MVFGGWVGCRILGRAVDINIKYIISKSFKFKFKKSLKIDAAR